MPEHFDLTVRENLIASRLATGVLVKTFLEIALVCVLVASAAYSKLHPGIRGVIDVASPDLVTGWAFDSSSEGDAVEVHLYIDGLWVGSQQANKERLDLVRAGAASGPNHGFSFITPALNPGVHTIQVYALRPSFGRGKILSPLSRSAITLNIE